MKKFTAILLFLIYGVASSGATIHAHYCMGKLRGISLFAQAKKQCPNCGMIKADNLCCKDVHKTISAQKDHQPAFAVFCISPVSLPAIELTAIPDRALIARPTAARSSHGPPGQLPLFVQYRNFRI